ncbi:MAG: CAP domain-containing protein [Campylobacter sp.]|nr:CAP domain-containing protein [Campylobacter sp.]
MPKLVLWLSLVFIFYHFAFKNEEAGLSASPPNFHENYDTLNYINSHRISSGLKALKNDKILNKSALAHANYLIINEIDKNVSLHSENKELKGFSGVNATERASKAGHSTKWVLENISSNQLNERTAVDSLFSAIYHRFSFLNIGADQIGLANLHDKNKHVYVYNLSNSKLNSLCKNGGDKPKNGIYYTQACNDKKIYISKQNYKKFIFANDPQIITYPHENALAYFGNEDPDPLKHCDITSNPVSVQFSDPARQIKLNKFEIYKDGKRLSDTILLDFKSDPNKIFKPNEFALFAKKPFDFNSTYEVKFSYQENKVDKTISWNFHTQTPPNPYFVVKKDEVLSLKADVWYDVFFMPKNCKDSFSSYQTSLSLFAKMQSKFADINTIRVKLSGAKGAYATLEANGVKVKLLLQNSSENYFGFSEVIFLILIAISILLLSIKPKGGL